MSPFLRWMRTSTFCGKRPSREAHAELVRERRVLAGEEVADATAGEVVSDRSR